MPTGESSLVDVIVSLATRSGDGSGGVATLLTGEVPVVAAAAATLRARGTAGRARAGTRDGAHAACITHSGVHRPRISLTKQFTFRANLFDKTRRGPTTGAFPPHARVSRVQESKVKVAKMPAPGRMDGHMSKASRDLSKGIAVKSNGFKYGGGKDEGWGTGGEKGRRVGKGGGRRDVAARARLREILERKRAAAEAGDEAGKTVGNKRKRGGGGGGDDRDAGNKAPRREEPKPAAVEPTEETPTGRTTTGRWITRRRVRSGGRAPRAAASSAATPPTTRATCCRRSTRRPRSESGAARRSRR